jgi:myosin heavy subunit
LGGLFLSSGIGESIDRKTYIGNILLSINPYKPLAQYTEQAIADYKLRTVAISQLPPHV